MIHRRAKQTEKQLFENGEVSKKVFVYSFPFCVLSVFLPSVMQGVWQLSQMLDNDLFEIISGENSSPYILTVGAKGVRGEVIMHALENEGIIVGNGSACSSKNRFSRVIEACGYDNVILDGVVRISFSTETTLDEAVFCAQKLNETVSKLKNILG